jgi:hypothetical protein
MKSHALEIPKTRKLAETYANKDNSLGSKEEGCLTFDEANVNQLEDFPQSLALNVFLVIVSSLHKTIIDLGGRLMTVHPTIFLTCFTLVACVAGQVVALGYDEEGASELVTNGLEESIQESAYEFKTSLDWVPPKPWSDQNLDNSAEMITEDILPSLALYALFAAISMMIYKTMGAKCQSKIIVFGLRMIMMVQPTNVWTCITLVACFAGHANAAQVYYERGLCLAMGIIFKVVYPLVYAAIVFVATTAVIFFIIGATHLSSKIISGRRMVLLQPSTILAYFALVVCFAGHVDHVNAQFFYAKGKCLNEANNGDPGCNAKEVTPSVTSIDGPSTCTRGTIIKINITLSMDLNAERFDLGIYLGLNGTSARTGTNTCLVQSLGPDDAGTTVSNVDGDKCWDSTAGISSIVIKNADILCDDTDNSGKVTFNSCFVWKTQGPNTNCNGSSVLLSIPDTKCQCGNKDDGDIQISQISIPSSNPSSNPSGNPSQNPSIIPSGDPSSYPSGNPSQNPSSIPSRNPSSNPSGNPSSNPSKNPSSDPSGDPSENQSSNPSGDPSSYPSTHPSEDPSKNPSTDPSGNPSGDPSSNPSEDPSTNSSEDPSESPSTDPSKDPSVNPSTDPSKDPSEIPSTEPSDDPSENPSSDPSENPSEIPSTDPSGDPSGDPSSNPSSIPSGNPTSIAQRRSKPPTGKPTSNPTPQVGNTPIITPTRKPSKRWPTKKPSTRWPTKKPSTRWPTKKPTSKPTPKVGATPITTPTRKPSTRWPTKKPSTRWPTKKPSTRWPTK